MLLQAAADGKTEWWRRVWKYQEASGHRFGNPVQTMAARTYTASTAGTEEHRWATAYLRPAHHPPYIPQLLEQKNCMVGQADSSNLMGAG